MGLKRFLVWGDVAFYFAVLVVAIRVAPYGAFWFAGIVIAAFAFPLWVLARLQLGSAFSFKPEARRLVTTGLYSKIRHPVYVFGTMAGLSGLLALQIWPLLAAGVVLIPITVLRIRREEQVLEAALGQEYETYRKQTWL